MSFIVIDTDVASAALRGGLPAPVTSLLIGKTVCITFVTLGELSKWTVMRDWGTEQARPSPRLAATGGAAAVRRGGRDYVG